MRRISALLLALLMTVSLTACSSPEEDAPTAGSEEGLFYEVTGLDPDAVMLTADGKDITVGMYLYWLVYTMSSVSTVSDWVDDAGLLKWDEEVSEGETVRDLVLEETLNTAKLYMIVETWADQYGFTLTLLSVGIRQFALILGVGVLVAFIGSFLPVMRIARKRPIDAIQNR